MGTRCLTVFRDEERGQEVCVLYRQSDGYPQGHGQELAEFLSGFQVVDGLSGEGGKVANGMGCLAAQAVAYFKQRPGGFYLYPSGTRDVWEDYVYTVYLGEGKRLRMKIESHGEVLIDNWVDLEEVT